MIIKTPPMGWNSWNTFGKNINEKLIMETAAAMIEKGYRDAGYEYVIIDDCWSLKERVDGKLVPDPELFPHGMKYLSDYIHEKGLKFGMYSCAGAKTCAGYPSSYGYEFEDAEQFAQWGVDYLKYDFCNFPDSADMKNAYLTMAMALRNSGRDIVFAACNWGVGDPEHWMRQRGAHTYRSTGDIMDNTQSFTDIFLSQYKKIGYSGGGFYNDMDMLTVGMRNNGLVACGGCTDDEYMLQFAIWAFMGSPLIIGGDIRNLDETSRSTLQNKGLISINQDIENRPPFIIRDTGKYYVMARILEGGKIAAAVFNISAGDDWSKNISILFDDLGIHSNTGRSVKVTDAITGEEQGIFNDAIMLNVELKKCRIIICEAVKR